MLPLLPGTGACCSFFHSACGRGRYYPRTGASRRLLEARPPGMTPSVWWLRVRSVILGPPPCLLRRGIHCNLKFILMKPRSRISGTSARLWRWSFSRSAACEILLKEWALLAYRRLTRPNNPTGPWPGFRYRSARTQATRLAPASTTPAVTVPMMTPARTSKGKWTPR
jgi:hypothetical protein